MEYLKESFKQIITLPRGPWRDYLFNQKMNKKDNYISQPEKDDKIQNSLKINRFLQKFSIQGYKFYIENSGLLRK